MNTGAAVPPSSSDQERWHHAFAHYVLRVATFQDPDFTFGALSAPDSAQRLVLAAMALLGRHYKLSVEQVMAFARSITVQPHRFDQDDGYLIEMPAPQRAGECFFLAIVRKGDGGIDYLTLERTDDGGVMLCGWDAEGNHLNHTDTPTRDLDGFIAEVIALRLRAPGA
jgi:hypothetical protein